MKVLRKKRKHHKCYICGKQEVKYKKLYLSVFEGFFTVQRIRFEGVNEFWLCPIHFTLNRKNILQENSFTQFKWIQKNYNLQ